MYLYHVYVQYSSKYILGKNNNNIYALFIQFMNLSLVLFRLEKLFKIVHENIKKSSGAYTPKFNKKRVNLFF